MNKRRTVLLFIVGLLLAGAAIDSAIVGVVDRIDLLADERKEGL